LARQARSVRYDVDDARVFAAFDLMQGAQRPPYDQFIAAAGETLATAPLQHRDPALRVDAALELVGERGRHQALNPVEGVMYRLERKGKVEFFAKFVRENFTAGGSSLRSAGERPSGTGGPTRRPPRWGQPHRPHTPRSRRKT